MKVIGALKAILGLDKTKFDRGLDQAEKKTSQFGNVIKKIGGFMAAAFSVAAIIGFTKKIISFSKEAMRAAAEVEGIKNAYTKFGAEGKRVLDDIKRATRGVIQEDELMQIAIKAKSLGIPFKDLGTYLTFATNQAIRLGKPVQEFADLMITAIGRGQGRGLVQMGLSLKETSAAFKDINGPLSFFTKKLEEMGTVADTTQIKMQRFTVSGIELKEAWGTWLNKADIPNTIRSYYTNLFNVWADETKTFAQKANAYLKTFGGIQLGEKTIWKSGQKKTEKERAAEGVNPAGSTGLQKLLEDVEAPAKKAEKTIADLRLELEEYKAQIEETTVSDQAHRTELEKKIYALEQLIEKLTTLKTKIEKLEKVKVSIPSVFGGFPAAPGIQPGPAAPTESQQELANIQAVTEELQNQQVAVDILSSAFSTLFTSTEDGFKAMIDSIIRSIERLVAELLARAVILAILNPGMAFGKILTTAFAGMGLAKGASGGTVPPGYPNDTFPAMLSSGETILSATESRNFSRRLDVHVSGDIMGRAIALVGRRTEKEN